MIVQTQSEDDFELMAFKKMRKHQPRIGLRAEHLRRGGRKCKGPEAKQKFNVFEFPFVKTNVDANLSLGTTKGP